MSAPASAAAATISRARPRSPRWFSPISATTITLRRGDSPWEESVLVIGLPPKGQHRPQMTDSPWKKTADQPAHRTDKPWHRYVFDADARAFVGDFEGLYQAESEGQWDAWNQ